MNAPFPGPHELLGPLPARREVRKAVILAAGRGRRMGKVTKDRPKAALEVAGHALLDWQIAALRRAGVEQIAVVTGHGAEILAGRDVDYIHNANWNMGTQVDTLLCATDWIGDEPVIVSYSDILYHPSAALALLERPGDIVIAYDADHRWLWKRRFGNWLTDSETFRLAPGQILAEIGGKPNDIEEVEGQFMGLVLLSAGGLRLISQHHGDVPTTERQRMDFTRLMSSLIATGKRIDTAANILPWMEIDSPRDLSLASDMSSPHRTDGSSPALVFPLKIALPELAISVRTSDQPDERTQGIGRCDAAAQSAEAEALGRSRAVSTAEVMNGFAIQNWGRSGSTFLQSLFDDHPQVLSTPNFYSRDYYSVWAGHICLLPDESKIEAFMSSFRQWWDTGLVDASAGLHQLGAERRELAGVDKARLEFFLRRELAEVRTITRHTLFCAAHLAYAHARNQQLGDDELQILFPIHGRRRAAACAFLEDFPNARFLHTVRHPVTNVASSIQHLVVNKLDTERGPIERTLSSLFLEVTGRYPGATCFGARPYLRHLALRDHVRIIRLEDLHSDAKGVLSSATRWLGIRDDPHLYQSTWEGKRWWNRPESGPASGPGEQNLERNVENRLSEADIDRLEAILERKAHLQDLYPETRKAPRSLLSRMIAVATPWRQELVGRPTRVDRLVSLLPFAALLPPRAAERLHAAILIERTRAQLLAMGSGAVEVRRRLTRKDRSSAVEAILLLRRAGDVWRMRILLRRSADLAATSLDRLTVGLLDDAVSTPTAISHLSWFFALTAGGAMASVSSFIRHRKIMFDLLFTANNRADSPIALILSETPPQPR